MALTCFPGALNPFCRPCICLSPCSNHVALATSSTLLYLYSYCDKKLSFITKFIPHSKSLSCMEFHPTLPGLLITGGAPNSRISAWSVEEKTIVKKSSINLQRRPNAMIWLSDKDLIIGDEHGGLYRWILDDEKATKLNSTTINEKSNDEVQFFAAAKKQRFILTIAYKSGLVGICHLDVDKNVLTVLHKLLPENVSTVCCSIQFSHPEAPIERSTLFYVSYAHGYVKVCDYANGKIVSQLILTKPSKTNNINDPRCKTYYPLIWLDANTLLTGNLDGHLIRIDVRHSSHLEKSQLVVAPPISGGKPIVSLAVKDEDQLFLYSFSRKLSVYDLTKLSLNYSLVSIPGSVNDIQACPLQTSTVAFGVDTANVGLLEISSTNLSSISFLWHSIPADVCRIAWHPIREGRIAYSTRLGHVGLYDTISGRSRVVYDTTYRTPGSPTAILWGPLIPNSTYDPNLAVLYSVGDGKLHRWDSPEKSCIPVELTTNVQESPCSIINVAFSYDRQYLSVLCLDGSLWLRSCPLADAIHHFTIGSSPKLLVYHPRYLLSTVEISSKQYWVAVNDRNLIRLIDTLEPSSAIKTELSGHTGEIECLAWSPTFDFMLASGSQDKTIRLWNVDTSEQLRIYTGHFDVVTSVLFSSSDPHVVLSGSRDHGLHIWHSEHHTQSLDQPILALNVDDDEELTTSNSKNKRSHKPRPNRAERERKRAARASIEENGTNNEERPIASSNKIMNEFSSFIYGLLWPKDQEHGSTSDLSLLPDKNLLLEKIQQHVTSRSNNNSDIPRNIIYHILFWSGQLIELKNELSTAESVPISNLFYWMALLNENSTDLPLFDRISELIKHNQQDYVLEYLSMLLKMKRLGDVFDYLLSEDFIETTLFLAILTDSITEIRNRLATPTPSTNSE